MSLSLKKSVVKIDLFSLFCFDWSDERNILQSALFKDNHKTKILLQSSVKAKSAHIEYGGHVCDS